MQQKMCLQKEMQQEMHSTSKASFCQLYHKTN